MVVLKESKAGESHSTCTCWHLESRSQITLLYLISSFRTIYKRLLVGILSHMVPI